jgi:beta-glucosidase
MDGDANALYSFGYGLSYTKFEYSDLQIKPGNGKDVLQTVTCTVKNTGNCDGQEIVQLYIRDMVASVAQAPILLKAFERITLKKGESKTVTFNLGKKELSIYNMNLEEVVEPGEFKVMVGAASNDIRLNGKFEL